MNRNNLFKITTLILLTTLLVTSCASKKDVIYFQDVLNYETIVVEETFVPRFKIGDMLGVNISSEDPLASAPFNITSLSSASAMDASGGGGQISTYNVDLDGSIALPVLGLVKVVGKSVAEVRTFISEKLIMDNHLKAPKVSVSLLNFNITVLGQVQSPGTFQIEGQRITLLQALGLAGDLKINGRRDNILVMRDFNGTKVSTRIDLTTKDALSSPVYYLTQNDVIYVEPNGSVVNSSNSNNRAVTFSIISLLLTLTTTVILVTRN